MYNIIFNFKSLMLPIKIKKAHIFQYIDLDRNLKTLLDIMLTFKS